MTDAATSLSLSPARFHDVDEFIAWEKGLGWDGEAVQLSAGANLIAFDHFKFPEMLVGHYCSPRRMHAIFEVPKGTVVFLICRKKTPVIWCGKEIPPTLMGILRSSISHWCVTPAAFDVYEFMVSEDLIRRTELFPPNFFRNTEQFERAYLPLAEPETGRFIKGLDAFFRNARTAWGSQAPPVCQTELCEFIVQGFLRVIDAGLALQNAGKPRTTRRPDLVMQARELFKTDMAKDWTAERLARELGVSYRALHYAFKDAVGVSPYHFFLSERLQAARRSLKSENASVTEACFAHGFHVPGRFAQQYARLFGELPSHTRLQPRGANRQPGEEVKPVRINPLWQ